VCNYVVNIGTYVHFLAIALKLFDLVLGVNLESLKQKGGFKPGTVQLADIHAELQILYGYFGYFRLTHFGAAEIAN
jgi:hypothetical protein